MAVQKPAQAQQLDSMSAVIQEFLTDGEVFHGDAYKAADAVTRFYLGVVGLTATQPTKEQVSGMILLPVTEFFNNPFYITFESELVGFRTQLASAYLSDNGGRFINLITETLSHIVFLANGRNIQKSTEFADRITPILWTKRENE